MSWLFVIFKPTVYTVIALAVCLITVALGKNPTNQPTTNLHPFLHLLSTANTLDPNEKDRQPFLRCG